MRMELNRIFKVIVICLASSLSALVLWGISFGQNLNKPIEQALKNYEAQKQKDQDELTTKLNFSLDQTIEDWLIMARKEKDSKLQIRLEQSWEKLAQFFTLPPVRYEYYLRGYKYTVTERNVIKTESLTFPYKARVIIKEEIYAEKEHHPNVSNATPYFYTVTTTYSLDFEYQENKFVLVNSDSKIVNIENVVPDGINKIWL